MLAEVGLRPPGGRGVRADPVPLEPVRRRLEHGADRQAEYLRELEVPLVVRGDCHDRAGAVPHQHVVGDEHGQPLAGHRVDRVGAGEDARLLEALLLPPQVGEPRGRLPVRQDRRRRGPVTLGLPGRRGVAPLQRRARWPPVTGRQLVNQRMLGRQHHVRGAGHRVGPGGVHADLLVRAGYRELDAGAVARTDPVPLHRLDRLWPVERVEVAEQAVGVGGDPQHPLPQRPPVHRVVADVAAAVGGDFLVGQHRAQPGAPVDQLLGNVGETVAVDQLAPLQPGQLRPRPAIRVGVARGLPFSRFELRNQFFDRPGAFGIWIEPAIEDLQEDPLRPPVVGDVRGRELAPAVVAEPEPAELPPHVGDVVPGGDRRVLPGVERVLLGRQPERVIAERVQHVVARHAQEARVHVGPDVAERVADVQPRAAGVGEHVHDEELRPVGDAVESLRQRAGRIRRVERSLRFPVVLPVQLDLIGEAGVIAERRVVAGGRAGSSFALVLPGAAGTLGHEILTTFNLVHQKSPPDTRGRHADSRSQRGILRSSRAARIFPRLAQRWPGSIPDRGRPPLAAG